MPNFSSFHNWPLQHGERVFNVFDAIYFYINPKKTEITTTKTFNEWMKDQLINQNGESSSSRLGACRYHRGQYCVSKKEFYVCLINGWLQSYEIDIGGIS